jgi:uncharacterized membrane protein
MLEADPALPTHIEETITTISQVHAEHHRRARPMQRSVAAATVAIGSPAFLGILTIAAAGWIALNLAVAAAGRTPPDPPPFAYLSGTASVLALYLAAMILATQKHDDELATHRDQLTLELAILSDRKSAKIISLLEELRRNDPVQGDHVDAEAEAMTVPADPKAVLDKIRSSHSEIGTQG